MTYWWRHKVQENFFKNVIYSGQFFGQNWAIELEMNDTLLKGNCLSFPKHPSKSQLSLVIIEIIALKVRQYWPKTTKTTFNTESKRNVLCTWKAPNMLIINANVAHDTFKVFYFKFVVKKKNRSGDNFQKSEKLTSLAELGYRNSANA